MAIQTNTLDKLQVLEAIYQKGYQSDIANRVFDKLIELERNIAQRNMADIKAVLQSFETHYQMASDDFFHRFHKGKLGDDADFFEWSAAYDMYKSILNRLAKLSDESL
jgi:hypothetical protein